jgi:hypothetical protein
MNLRLTMLIPLLILAGLGRPSDAQIGVPDSVSYQGYLEEAGSPVNDASATLTFRLYKNASGGTAFWTETQSGVQIADGVFSVLLGSVSSLKGKEFGGRLWLTTAIGDASAPELSPPRPLTAVPYALSLRGLRVSPSTSGAVNLIGGDVSNQVRGGVQGATIGGGGTSTAFNRVVSNFGTVGGGTENVAGDESKPVSHTRYATVGGGDGNAARGHVSTVAGGESNAAAGSRATVGGGGSNVASGLNATVAGGTQNQAQSFNATVGGGYTNIAGEDNATVGGGSNNQATGAGSVVVGGTANQALLAHATVGGGFTNRAAGESAVVGGGYYNTAETAFSTVSGGGPVDLADAVNTRNRACDQYATVGGGCGNVAGSCDDGDDLSSRSAVVGGGQRNVASGRFATVGGGVWNTASDYASTVGGGDRNTASGFRATVAGGVLNYATDQASSVGGGYENHADGGYAAVCGGRNNIAGADDSFVGGGAYNIAGEESASVLGGAYNRASGRASFAGGTRAKAWHEGSFAWSDRSQPGDADSLFTTAANQFLIRAAGGVGIGTNEPFAGTLHFRNFDLDFDATAQHEDDMVVEAKDAVLGLYSNSAGTWGSALVLGQVNEGTHAYENKWTISRRTHRAENALHFTFGSDDDYGLNNTVFRVDTDGSVHADGPFVGGGADLAEAVDTEGPACLYDPGDVLVISTASDRTVEISTRPFSRLVAGVYARRPGVLLAEEDVDPDLSKRIPLAVVGIVPTKVTLENGPIGRGDLLVTSSTAGHAMRADPNSIDVGTVLGKALQEYDGPGPGLIDVLVTAQ